MPHVRPDGPSGALADWTWANFGRKVPRGVAFRPKFRRGHIWLNSREWQTGGGRGA